MTFEDEQTQQHEKPQQNTLSLADELKQSPPLFTELPVNNNTTYAYDDDEITEQNGGMVFEPNSNTNRDAKGANSFLKEATFYKSLFMRITLQYSVFVYYTLFPSFLFIELDSVQIGHMCVLVGLLSLVRLVFQTLAYWLKIDKKKPVWLWVFSWLGTVGFFSKSLELYMEMFLIYCFQ